MKTIAFALALAVIPGFSQAPAPQAPPPPPAQHRERPRPEEFHKRMQDRVERALHLTDAQKASIKEIRARHHDGLQAKAHAAKDAGKAFMEAMHKPDTKVEDLKTLHRAQADANLDLLLEHRAMRQEIKAVLTPEQREKAARLEGRMEGMRMGRRGGFDGEGGRGGWSGEGGR